MLVVGELEGKRLAGGGGGLGEVGGGGGVGVGVDLDRVGLEVEDDVLGDAGGGAGGEFSFLIARQGTVGGFDDAQDVGGRGEARAVVVGCAADARGVCGAHTADCLPFDVHRHRATKEAAAERSQTSWQPPAANGAGSGGMGGPPQPEHLPLAPVSATRRAPSQPLNHLTT